MKKGNQNQIANKQSNLEILKKARPKSIELIEYLS